MIALILSVSLIGLTILFSVIMGITGWRRGWKHGLRLFAFTVIALILSFFIGPYIAPEICSWESIQNLRLQVSNFVWSFGINGLLFEHILSSSIIGVVSVPASIAVFILTFIAECLLWSGIKAFLKREPQLLSKRSRFVGLILGILTPVFICLFSITVPRINLINEAQNCDKLVDISASAFDNPIAAIPLIDIYFNTQLIKASEKERLELITYSLKSYINSNGDDIVRELVNDMDYITYGALNADLQTISEFTDLIGEIGSLENIFDTISKIPDKKEFADKLYSLQVYEPLVRMIMTYAVQNISGNSAFVYPSNTDIEGTQSDFAKFLEVIPEFSNEDTASMKKLIEIKNSPLLPPEVFAAIYRNIR